MRIYNRYIITVSTLLLLTTVILIALSQTSLDVYYTVYVIEALVVTELYIYFSAVTRLALNRVSAILLGGFILVLFVQLLKIIT